MLTKLFAYLCRFPVLKRLLWRRWYQYLARRFAIPEWQTMNYGFSKLPVAEPVALDPAEEGERYGLQLYHAVCGGCSLLQKQVLEVGCGRGGGAAFLHRSEQPAKMIGVDFSIEAIALCRERYQRPGLEFFTGDAERLEFEAGTFDVVVNVESSHCYGSMSAFLSEVHRVLKPGGRFVCADFRDHDKVQAWREQLTASGLKMIAETEITPNVLAALDADNDRKLALMRKILPPRLFGAFSDFAAVKGSLVYEHFRTGEMRYFRFELVKE